VPPHSQDRRKVLLALAFGGVNVLVLRNLPPSRSNDPLAPVAVGPSEPAVLPGFDAPAPQGHTFDVVLRGGRVMDPDTGFDSVADVGIDATTITAIVERAEGDDGLQGRRVIDADGLVVAPGFIDILSYDPNDHGIWYKVADGVTSNLGMHGLNARADQYFAYWDTEGSPCHYGGAFDTPWARASLGIDPGKAASSAQVGQLVAMAEENLANGWMGVDFEPEYTPGVEYEEILAQARVAAAAGVPCFFHGRYSDMEPPGTNVETLEEILRVAREAVVPVHVEHITSTGGTFSMQQSLATLEAARSEGVDVTACMYPYDHWATYLGSPRFNEGWQERFRISYEDLEIAGTGERLTASSFRRYREQNLLAAAHAIPVEDVIAAFKSPLVMLGSDGILEPGNNNHPRGAGTFARALGRFVREEGLLPLMDALGKATIMPARRLEARAPDLRRKGRLQVGADADITVFDPATIRDRATVANPAQASVGVEWVLVLGQVVKDPDQVHRDVKPGRAIRSQLA
jgi:N-acyl-D-aspartate/D-glutamate deacylase